jgi:TRAP-type C4-dicarboxylate transport system substrate-binding protein
MFQTLTKTAMGIALAATVGLAAAATTASAADLPKNSFKVVGTWGNLTNYQAYEGPFWNKTVTEESNGAITAHAPPLTELGLKGFEVMRLLKLGVFDFAFGVIGYVASEDAVFEGVDLSIVAQDIKTARKITEVYRPILAKAFEKTFGAKLMLMYPFPSQLLYCNGEINSVKDLNGKKIRVYSTTLGDFVEGVGANSVTVAFAEVVPALQKGVVDCGITGTMPAYKAKWWQVANTVYAMRVGWGISFGAFSLKRWNQLDKATQEFFTKQTAKLEDELWKGIGEEDEMGVICNTGVGGKCTVGEPGGMKLVKPSEADLEERKKILKDFVLKRWAERCGPECVKNWNDTVGKLVGIKAGG